MDRGHASQSPWVKLQHHRVDLANSEWQILQARGGTARLSSFEKLPPTEVPQHSEWGIGSFDAK